MIHLRNPYFDNAKLILIFLVVLGHLIEKTMLSQPLPHYIYTFVYMFHMPAFILLCGFFSKDISSIPLKIKKLAIYYLVFEVIYAPFFFNNYTFPIEPYWVMWFLLSLIMWNIMLPFLIKFKHAIILVSLIGVMVGYVPNIGYGLSLSRTFVFLPFFVAGYYLKEFDFKRLNLPAVKVASILFIAVIFVMNCKVAIPYRWLYGSFSYSALGNPEWYAGIYRMGIYAVSALLCLSFFAIVPHKKYRFTYMGANTLNTYLLHGIFVVVISHALASLGGGLIGLILVAFVLVVSLSSNVINRTVAIIANPNIHKHPVHKPL